MEAIYALLVLLLGAVASAAASALFDRVLFRELWRALVAVFRHEERVSLGKQYRMARKLARKIQEHHIKPRMIFAVCPGGAMIGEWLSRKLLGNARDPIEMRVVFVRDEDERAVGQKARMPKVAEPPAATVYGLNKADQVLLVTDVLRGGLTMRAAHAFLSTVVDPGNVKTATLYWNETSRFDPDLYVERTTRHVLFDWKLG